MTFPDDAAAAMCALMCDWENMAMWGLLHRAVFDIELGGGSHFVLNR